MGLKAGVLAVMAGIALYPKISAEADVIEREQRMKNERKEIFKRRDRDKADRDARASGRRGGGSDRGTYRDSGRRDGGRRERDDRAIMRVDEYDMRKGEGYRRMSEGDNRRRGSLYRDRDYRLEEGSVRSGGSNRTQDWVEGGYEYLNENDYRERDRRRW